MANISLYRGGTPVVKFMWCDKDHPVYTPPFRQRHEGTTSNLFADERPLAETPPYDSHADGAYNLGNFVIGMPCTWTDCTAQGFTGTAVSCW